MMTFVRYVQINFCAKLGKSITGVKADLTMVYGDPALKNSSWYKTFLDGRES